MRRTAPRAGRRRCAASAASTSRAARTRCSCCSASSRSAKAAWKASVRFAAPPLDDVQRSSHASALAKFPAVPPRLVVIDSVGARFAQDKAWEPGHGRGLQSRIAAALSELKRDGATIAFSRAIPADRRSAAPETAAREHLSPAWLELVTKRVKLARIARRQHQPDPPAEGRSMVWQEIEARRATAAAAPRIMAVRPVTSDANFAVITSAGVLPEPL